MILSHRILLAHLFSSSLKDCHAPLAHRPTSTSSSLPPPPYLHPFEFPAAATAAAALPTRSAGSTQHPGGSQAFAGCADCEERMAADTKSRGSLVLCVLLLLAGFGCGCGCGCGRVVRAALPSSCAVCRACSVCNRDPPPPSLLPLTCITLTLLCRAPALCARRTPQCLPPAVFVPPWLAPIAESAPGRQVRSEVRQVLACAAAKRWRRNSRGGHRSGGGGHEAAACDGAEAHVPRLRLVDELTANAKSISGPRQRLHACR